MTIKVIKVTLKKMAQMIIKTKIQSNPSQLQKQIPKIMQ